MSPDLDPLLMIAQEQGCFLRREALDFGVDDRALARGVRGGELVRLRQGCYVPSQLWTPATDSAKLLMRTKAVVRVADGPVAATHTSGCSAFDVDLWGVDMQRAHVTRLDGGAGRVDADATHHEGLWTDQDLVTAQGLTTLGPERSVLELTSLFGVEAGLVAADSALRSEIATVEELRRQQQLMLRWPRAQAVRLVANLADGRSGSAGESRSRYMMWARGMPMPELQYEVYDGSTLVGICDFCWPEYGLLGEFDGRVKYGRLLKPGQDPGEVVFDEKVREDMLRELTGWRMVRWIWHDLSVPRYTCERIERQMRRGSSMGRLGA